ncbi:hypothetical protein Hanom_Chr06g00478561 [Helianthus anomalus]
MEPGLSSIITTKPGFINLLNQPLSWDPNQGGWNPNFNMDGYSSSQGEPEFVSETQPETTPEEEPETTLDQTKRGKRASHKKKETTANRVKKPANVGC